MKGLLACIAMAVVALPSIAPAEPPIGSRLGDRYETRAVTQDRERAAGAHEIANCLAAKRSREVRAYLSAATGLESRKLGQRLGVELQSCFLKRPMNDTVEGERIAYPPPILRGMLAEELIKKDRSAFARLPTLPIQKAYMRAWYPASFRNTAVNEMATCVADTNPAGVVELLDSEPYTDSEDSAFSALMPFMGPCLSAGTQLSGEREPLRSALAEALYQRVNLPADLSVASQGAGE